MARGPVAVILVVLASFGLAEASLRLLDLPLPDSCWSPDDPTVWTDDPALGFRLLPDIRVGEAEVNALGLRGPALPLEKAPDVTRILFVGDSTVFGLGVPLEETFAYRATTELAKDAPERRFEYLIGAVPGYSAWQSRTLLQRLLPYRPDLVVFYVGARNDADRARYFADAAWPARHARREAGWHALRTLRALELLGDTIWTVSFRRWRPRAWQARVPPDDFADHVRAMLEATRDAGARALVLVPPHTDGLEKHLKILPRYRDALREAAAASGVPHVALQPVFQRGDESALYFPDLIHPSAAGHQRIADEIVRRARADGLAAPSSGPDSGARDPAPE